MRKKRDAPKKESKKASEKKNLEICPDKETAIKENKKLAKLRQRKQESPIKATKKAWKKGLDQGKEAIENFSDPDLLLNIKKELDKDHVGDDKAKLFLFACACSSRLLPQYRFSTAITGEQAEGKDNLWKTIYYHLPEGWFLDLTRATQAALEDDIKQYNGLYFGEGNFEGGGANAAIRDTIKQLVEDGTSVLKKDKKTDSKKSKHEKQPRKVGIYSTTKHSTDRELASRYCIISVHGSPSKYRQVNDFSKTVAGNIDLQINQFERKNKSTWIQDGLKTLKKFDFIIIPYAPFFEVESRDSRSQRDFKRFLNFIASLAWICQRTRVRFKYKGYSILVTSIEDFYNAIEIGKEIFDQSLSGLEPRLKEVIESLQKIIKENPNAIKKDIEGADPDLVWVDRHLVQQDIGLKSRDPMIERVKILSDKGILAYFNRGSRAYIAFKYSNSASNLPSNYPLITVDQKELYEYIKRHDDDILSELLDGKSTVKSTLTSPDSKISSNLLSLENSDRRQSTKNVYDEHELDIIKTLKRKFDGKKSTVTKNGAKDRQKTLTENMQNADHDMPGNSIDLSKYEMTVRRIEDVLGSEKLPGLQIARRMDKTNMSEIGFIDGLLKQAVSDSSFDTSLRVDSEGCYFNERKENERDE